MTSSSDALPFSRPIPVREIGYAPTRITVEAEPAERSALARLLGVPSVDRLKAAFELRARHGGRIAVHGTLEANVVQACILTLAPVPVDVSDEIDMVFAPPGDEALYKPGEELDLDAFGEDPPDVIEGDAIDLGALAAEHLSLALDPYPRAPGATFDEISEGEGEDVPPSPFAALARLKRNEAESDG